MIFRASMRRAKVRPVHVLRCTVYCCDCGIWLLLVLAVVLPTVGEESDFSWWNRTTATTLLAAAAIALLTFYRLARAYRLYLKFDHPWATAAASQIILLLLTAVVLVNRVYLWR
jgi:hypothetical protein